MLNGCCESKFSCVTNICALSSTLVIFHDMKKINTLDTTCKLLTNGSIAEFLNLLNNFVLALLLLIAFIYVTESYMYLCSMMLFQML